MKKTRFTVLSLVLILSFTCHGQKVKTTKTPVAWSYEIAPKNPLAENLKSNQVVVETDLDPMDFWDKVDWSAQTLERDEEKIAILYNKAVNDTIKLWSSNYLALTTFPFVETSANPDFIITLTTDQFEAQNVQLDVDFSDNESVIFELNVTARLTVKTSTGETLLDERITYLLDDENGETALVKLKHFMLDPTFKTRFQFAKKPEKKKKLLERKVKKYEAYILEYFFIEGGEILKDNFVNNKVNSYAAIFGVKDKSLQEFNEKAEEAAKAINSLSAFSKKKRQTIEQVTPILKSAIEYWENQLASASNPEIKKLINANIATASVLIGDVESAKRNAELVPEFAEVDNKSIFQGSFDYYIQGLANAIKTCSRFAGRTEIYQP